MLNALVKVCLLTYYKYEATFPVEYHADHLMIGLNDQKMQLINNLLGK